MNSKNGNKAPKIRFPEFTDDWEQCKVSDITTSYSGGTPQAGNAEYYNGDIPFIRSGEIYGDHTELFITQKGMDNSSAKMVSKGDILYALYGATSGEVSRAGLDGAINQAILAIIPNENYNADFIVEWFRKEKANIIDKYLQGGQGNLSAQIIKNLEIGIPSYEEQNRIGDFFSGINNLITLHQRKLEKLKDLKKAYLIEMFPQDGETKPEIRFTGYTDDWEQRKLGEFADIVTGKLDANAMKEDGEYDFYTSGIQKYKIDVPAFEGPAITIAGNGATVGYMHLADGKFNAYQRTYVLSAFQANREFLFYEIGNKLPQKIAQEARTGNIPYIVMDMLTDLQLSIPSEQEQSKIGEFLMNLDNLITLHQRKLKKIEGIKKAYLNEMFV